MTTMDIGAHMKQHQLATAAEKYWPEELVDYDPAQKYRRDANGFHLCEATIKCPNFAIDYCGYCAEHQNGRGARAISRFDAFRMGALPVEQLEDWELVRGVARQPKGVRPNKHLREVSNANMVPLEQYRAMVAELFKRHDEKLRGMADNAIETLFDIMMNDANEPADRIKAATWIYERVRGKTAETLKVQVESTEPWQQVIEGVARVTREQAMGHKAIEQALEAEIIEEPVPPTPEAVYVAEPAAEQPAEDDDDEEAEYEEAEEPLVVAVSATEAQAAADSRAERIKAEKERRTKARNRRYAARAQGWDNADDAKPIVKGNKVIQPEDVKSPEPKRDYS